MFELFCFYIARHCSLTMVDDHFLPYNKNIIYAMISVPSAKHAQKNVAQKHLMSERRRVHPRRVCSRVFLTVRKRCSIGVIYQPTEVKNKVCIHNCDTRDA